MKILSIDSSTKNFSLAVSQEERVVRSKNIVLKKVLSSSIIPGINQILKQANVALDELDGFAVGLGPGSFTSLRVGLSTIKGLAFALSKPVVGISSLDVIAQGVGKEKLNKNQTSDICVICDARRNLLYACFYRVQDNQLKRKGDYLLTTVEDLAKQVREETLFVGDGISLFHDQIKSAVKKFKIHFADEQFWYPQAKYLAPLAYVKFQNQEFDDINRLVPLYLYPQDCQIDKAVVHTSR